MSERAWGAINSVLAALLAITLVCGFTWAVWDIATSNAYYTLNAKHYADHYAAEAEQDIESACVGLKPTDMAKCIRQIIEAAHEQQRSEYDLAAQRGMAKWALYLLAVSSAGVLLVGITFWETRKAAQAADAVVVETRRIGEAQVRAYLSVDTMLLAFPKVGEFYKFALKIENKGKSPANGIRITFGCNTFPDETTLNEIIVGDLPFHDPPANYVAPGNWIRFERETDLKVTQANLDLSRSIQWPKIAIIGRVDYEDVYDRTWSTTFCSVFFIKDRGSDGEEGGWWPHHHGNYMK